MKKRNRNRYNETREFLEDENEDMLSVEQMDKAKILVTVIPFVLIIVILAITLGINSCQKDDAGQENEKLQESIKEYADNKMMYEDIVSKTETIPPIVLESATANPSEIPTTKPSETEERDYSDVTFHAQTHLAEMMSYWEENNKTALDDLVNLDHFKAMSYSLKGTDDFYFYGQTTGDGIPNGKGIAVYADNQYYYGDWKDGVRSGIGTWMHYHIHEKKNNTDLYIYHQYVGMWANDLPNGDGAEHYDINTKILKPNIGYNTNLSGSYLDGMIHGDFYLTNLYSDGNVKEWTAKANEGSWIYCADSVDAEGRMPAYIDMQNDENYIWLHPDDNVNVGVSCLISKNKN